MPNMDLETTNWLLGVMAVASAIQTLMLIVLAVAGYRLYRQVADNRRGSRMPCGSACGSRSMEF